MTDETALIVEHISAVRQDVHALRSLVESHIAEDRAVAKTVARHSTYWGITKWIVVTVAGLVAGLFGIRSHG